MTHSIPPGIFSHPTMRLKILRRLQAMHAFNQHSGLVYNRHNKPFLRITAYPITFYLVKGCQNVTQEVRKALQEGHESCNS